MTTSFLATCVLTTAAVLATATGLGAAGDGTLGTALYTESDLTRTKWSYAEQTDLRCRMVLESLVPTTVPDDVQVFLEYFGLLQEVASAVVVARTVRQRAMLMVADAIGAYVYSKLLPRVDALYYEGRVEYATAKRLHNQMKKIKYVLDTDGRGWAKPVVVSGDVRGGPGGPDPAAAAALAAVAEPPDRRCGGVDAGPYGLAAGRDVPLFDDDARPHSMVVQWTAGRYALFSVRDAGCYRMLFDHCAREEAATAPQERRARDLRAWIHRTVRPLTTSADGRWYPALWGVRSIARRLARDALIEVGGVQPMVYPPNGYFYAYLFLIEQLVIWSIALVCTRQFQADVIACVCAIFVRALKKVFDN